MLMATRFNKKKSISKSIVAILLSFSTIIVMVRSSTSWTSQKKTRVKRVVSHEHASIEDFPWSVLLVGPEGKCGAALVDQLWLLTAAHCVGGGSYWAPSKTMAYLGIDRKSAMLKIKRRVVKIVKLKQEYFPESHGDIALLKLNRPVSFGRNIQPIQLNTKREWIYDKTAYLAGFGRWHPMLKFSNRKLRSGRFFFETRCPEAELRSDEICAVSEFNQMCDGDSGSGLVVYNSNATPILVGIATKSPKRCEPKRGSYYTDVAYYYEWIMSTINSNI